MLKSRPGVLDVAVVGVSTDVHRRTVGGADFLTGEFALIDASDGSVSLPAGTKPCPATEPGVAESIHGVGKAWLYRLVRGLLRTALRLLWPVTRSGLENVPGTGPVILAPNHVSFFDSVLLIAVSPRRICFLGKAEYLDSWRTRYVFPWMGMIPIQRGGGRKTMEALDTATAALDRGELMTIFPEGTRARDGYLHKGRTGVARLALRTGAAVIPVGITGTDTIQPPGARFPRPFHRCEVRFGSPIELGHYRSHVGDGRVYRRLTDEVMFEISGLCGRSYLNRYTAPEPVTL